MLRDIVVKAFLLPSVFFPETYGKDKQSRTIVDMVRTDCNQSYATALGKRVQHELNSTVTCAEITVCYTKRTSEWGVGAQGLSIQRNGKLQKAGMRVWSV